MTRYSVQLRDRIFVKGFRFLSFARNLRKNTSKNVSKNLSSKYSQKLYDHAKQSARDALKTALKRVIQKAAETTGDLIGNEIADKITKVSKIYHIIIKKQLQMKDIYLQKKRQQIINDL